MTNAAQSGTFSLGGELAVNRLGYGAMRITGNGVWGPPRDRDEALRVLRRAIELGVNFIDTAESYGPRVSEELIAEALHPYPDDLVIATKGGFDRTGPNQWVVNCRPERLRQELDESRARLKMDRIDLYQLHRIDSKVPEDEQFAFLRDAQQQGEIRHVGLSEVTVAQIERARKYFDVVSVQNRYNLADREWESVLDYCEREQIAFIPWYPVAAGKLTEEGGPLTRIAKKHDATPAQVAIAWLLRRSPVMLPIPGTSKVEHLEQNVDAARIALSDDEFAELGQQQ
ncbi:MAG TPA: aldo/keto reductase [Thermoanaerobaculia bacterium]|jgi:aryl-alcohol dehydrogenase-like predicted oxidoreductase